MNGWIFFGLMSVVFFGYRFALVMFALYSVFGIIFFLFLRNKNLPPIKKVIGATLGWIIAILVFNLGWKFFTGQSFIIFLTEFSRDFAALTISSYYDLRISSTVIENIEKQIIFNIGFFRDYFAAWIIISSSAGAWILHKVLSRRSEIDKLPRLEESRMPESFIWILIYSGALYILKGYVGKGSLLSTISINSLIILLAAYFISGLGVIFKGLKTIKFALGMSWFFIIASIVFMRAFYLIVLAGIIDVWVDFRKIKTEV